MNHSSSGNAVPSPDSPASTAVLLNAAAIHRALIRIAHEIAERNEDGRSVVLLGIQAGGAPLSARIAQTLVSLWNHPVSHGVLDISMHRDDLDQRFAPEVLPTSIPCDVSGRTVILVDDVLFSGRTIRAAMDALNDFGRPAQIQLAALVDRGHRELPIRADFVGKNIPTSVKDKIKVRLQEVDGTDEVILERGGNEA